jgi:hypothetical protein
MDLSVYALPGVAGSDAHVPKHIDDGPHFAMSKTHEDKTLIVRRAL